MAIHLSRKFDIIHAPPPSDLIKQIASELSWASNAISQSNYTIETCENPDTTQGIISKLAYNTSFVDQDQVYSKAIKRAWLQCPYLWSVNKFTHLHYWDFLPLQSQNFPLNFLFVLMTHLNCLSHNLKNQSLIASQSLNFVSICVFQGISSHLAYRYKLSTLYAHSNSVWFLLRLFLQIVSLFLGSDVLSSYPRIVVLSF